MQNLKLVFWKLQEGGNMKFRHEFKHEISEFDFLTMKSKLDAMLIPDQNGDSGTYLVKSLYFDNLYDTALREKVAGVNHREKFRIRGYENDTSFLKLEKKSKINGLCNKVSTRMTAHEVERIIAGDLAFMEHHSAPLIVELFLKMRNQGLMPKTIVEYTRSAYTYPAGNVRITLDYNIRTGLSSTDFLSQDCITIPAGDKVIILEVKWDEYIPDFVKTIVQLDGRRAGAYSKYGACRVYG